MNLYQTLAEQYDQLFPDDKALTPFLLGYIPEKVKAITESKKNILLDLGCGTGSALLGVASAGYRALGTDLSEGLLNVARKKAVEQRVRAKTEFLKLDIRHISSLTGRAPFPLVTILGNTLVHITPAEQESVLIDAAALQEPGDNLIIQILDYDALSVNKSPTLPQHDTEAWTFERFNTWLSDGTLRFSVRMTDKESGKVVEDSTRLYPVGQKWINEALARAGYQVKNTFGGFEGEPSGNGALPLVVCACKS